MVRVPKASVISPKIIANNGNATPAQRQRITFYQGNIHFVTIFFFAALFVQHDQQTRTETLQHMHSTSSAATREERIAPFAAAPTVPKNMSTMSTVSAALQGKPVLPRLVTQTAAQQGQQHNAKQHPVRPIAAIQPPNLQTHLKSLKKDTGCTSSSAAFGVAASGVAVSVSALLDRPSHEKPHIQSHNTVPRTGDLRSHCFYLKNTETASLLLLNKPR